MRHAITPCAAALAFLVTGCSDDGESSGHEQGPRTLIVPTVVTRVVVQAPDGRVLKRIDGSGEIQRILGFLQTHREGWRYSDSGFPTPPLELFFYSGDQRLGRFGISCAWYFERPGTSRATWRQKTTSLCGGLMPLTEIGIPCLIYSACPIFVLKARRAHDQKT